MKAVTKVKPPKEVKEPVPSPPRRWREPKRFQATATALSVLRRYLEASKGS